MPEEALAGRTGGLRTPCHCCGSQAEIPCPLCAILHCGRCQGNECKDGASYIPLGFCPDCRALLFRSIETWERLKELLASGPGAPPPADNGLEEAETSGWQEQVENSFLVLSEARYLSKRSSVPLRGMDAIEGTIADFRGRFIQLTGPGGADGTDYSTEGWKQINDQFGRITLFLRVGEALLAGSADVPVEELRKESEKALVAMFMIILRERCIEFLASPTRRTIEESWARLAELYARLLGLPGGKTPDYPPARASLGHLSNALDLLVQVLPLSRHLVPGELLVAKHEALRFELHQSLSCLLRTGVESPLLNKFLVGYLKHTEDWIEGHREPVPSDQSREAFRVYLEAGRRAFDTENQWALKPDDPGAVREARGWAWTALCAGHLAGHFEGESVVVGNLWVGYIAGLDRRLVDAGPARMAGEEGAPSLVGDAALFALASLLRRARAAGTGVWEASLVFHSLWNLMDRGAEPPDRQLLDFASALFGAIDRRFPWAARYLKSFRGLEEAAPGPARAEPEPVREADDWAALAAMGGVRVTGEPPALARGLWVVHGNKLGERPAAIPGDGVVVDLGADPEGLSKFTGARGWEVLYRLCARHGAGRAGLVAVLDIAGDRPVLFRGEGPGSGAAQPPENVVTVHDPELLLFPSQLKEAGLAWSSGHLPSRRGMAPLGLMLANPALLALKGALGTGGENK